MALIKTKALTIKAGREVVVCTQDPDVVAPLEMRGWGWVPAADLEAAGGTVGPRATRVEVQLLSDTQRDFQVDLAARKQPATASKFVAQCGVRQVVDFDDQGRKTLLKGSGAKAWVDRLGMLDRMLLDGLSDLVLSWSMGQEPDRDQWRRGFLEPAELEEVLALLEAQKAAVEEPPQGPKSGPD